MRPGSLSARKISPFGAVRSNRGLSNPPANSSTLYPAGATGHAFSGRATSSAPLFEDLVSKGSGRSLTVIFRIVPGFSYRKSVNGACGAAPLIVAVLVSSAGGAFEVELAGAAFPTVSDSTYVT